MDCKVDFVIPKSAAYTKEQLQASILDIVIQNTLAQLLWLKDTDYVSGYYVEPIGVYMDFHVVQQIETLLSALANLYPDLSASFSGHYDRDPYDRDHIWHEERGASFLVELKDGSIGTEVSRLL